MFNLVSLLIGGVAAVFTLIALTPLLGAANWLILPFAVVGLFVGVLSSHNSGRNLNLAVLAVAIGRLMLGGGIF